MARPVYQIIMRLDPCFLRGVHATGLVPKIRDTRANQRCIKVIKPRNLWPLLSCCSCSPWTLSKIQQVPRSGDKARHGVGPKREALFRHGTPPTASLLLSVSRVLYRPGQQLLVTVNKGQFLSPAPGYPAIPSSRNKRPPKLFIPRSIFSSRDKYLKFLNIVKTNSRIFYPRMFGNLQRDIY